MVNPIPKTITMENRKEEEMEQDEIINLEQFQVGRAPEEEKEIDQDDSTYTEDEIPFADGEGTQLEEELGEDDIDGELDDTDDDLETDDLPDDESTSDDIEEDEDDEELEA